MIHLTLNTGDTRESPRHEVRDDVIALLRPLVRAGGGPLPVPFDAYRVELARQGPDALIHIGPAAHPIILAGLVQRDTVGMWQLLTAMMDRFALPRPSTLQRPAVTPWLGVVLLTAASACPPEDLYALADVERCVAWTLIEESTPDREVS